MELGWGFAAMEMREPRAIASQRGSPMGCCVTKGQPHAGAVKAVKVVAGTAAAAADASGSASLCRALAIGVTRPCSEAGHQAPVAGYTESAPKFKPRSFCQAEARVQRWSLLEKEKPLKEKVRIGRS